DIADGRGTGAREQLGSRELAAAGAVRADEIGVAEAAVGGLAVLLAPRPQVAAGKPAEDRGGAGIRALTLQRVENFLYGIHRVPSLGRAAAVSSGGTRSVPPCRGGRA